MMMPPLILFQPEGPFTPDNCITPGANRIFNEDGTEYYDDYDRDWKERHRWHTRLNGVFPVVPQNDTITTWSYAAETCDNLEGGTERWRLCSEKEMNTNICCAASSGVNMCEIHSDDAWTSDFCDSVTACGVVEEWQYVVDNQFGYKRGDQLKTTPNGGAVKSFCTSKDDTAINSARDVLCSWEGGQDGHCVPRDNVPVLSSNSGDAGWWVYLNTTTHLQDFPFSFLEEYDSPEDGITTVLVFMDKQNATFYAVCANTGVVNQRQCVHENSNFASNPNSNSVWETCSSKSGISTDTRRRRLSTHSATENLASVFSPTTYAYVLDGGLTKNHETFSGRVEDGYDTWAEYLDTLKHTANYGLQTKIGLDDINGHGTHVAGIISGSMY